MNFVLTTIAAPNRECPFAAPGYEARRSFRRYWRVIYPGSAAIRLAWLRAIRRRAER